MAFSGMTVPEELRLLQDTVRRFIQREVVPVERELGAEAIRIPADTVRVLQEKARALGLWMLGMPAEYGGGGLSHFAQCLATEEAVKHATGLFEPAAGAFGGQEPPRILCKGSPDQIERYLIPSIREGRRWWISITEPGGGSDPARAIRTRAVRQGDHYVINGRKIFSTWGDEAPHGILFARTAPEQGRGGITAFIVDAGTPGIEVRKVNVIRDHHSTEIVYDNVKVPVENRLGEEGQGFALAQEWFIDGRVWLAAECVGIAEHALSLAIGYMKERETFGAPLATRQGLQWMVADSAVEIQAARLLTWQAAAALDDGRDGKLESSIAKLYATEMAFRVLDRVMQIHGGMGMAREMPLERWFRHVRVMRIVEGPSEVHRHVIARQLLGTGR